MFIFQILELICSPVYIWAPSSCEMPGLRSTFCSGSGHLYIYLLLSELKIKIKIKKSPQPLLPKHRITKNVPSHHNQTKLKTVVKKPRYVSNHLLTV